jgi:uncharacterized coiled-coil protein SlyX/G:T/U-mismatch repair DNA glycosylase
LSSLRAAFLLLQNSVWRNKRMSEIINIKIQADQSGAEEALKQVNNSLKEGTEAAEALSHVLDGDVAGAFKSLGELSKTLGAELGLAFSPAEIIAFVQVIADVTDKLSKLIADTFIYTDEQKALDAQIKSSNQVIAGYATDIKKLDDEFEKMGKTASQKTAIDIAKLKPQLDAASEAVRTLEEDLEDAKKNAANRDLINALGNAKAIPGLNDALGVAQQHLKLLNAQMRNLKEAFREQHAAESELNAEAQKSKAAFAKAQTDKVATVNTATSTIISIDEKGNQQAMAADFAAIKAENDAVIKAANEQLQTWDEGYKGQIEVAKITSETKIQLITQDFEKGKITQQQEIASIAQEKERELEIEKITQQKRWALWDGDKKKQQEIQNQIDKIIAQSKLVQTKAVTDGLKAQEQQYRQVFSQIGNAFKTEIVGMIQGTETVAQGFAKMFNSLIGSFADYVAQKAEKKAEEWLIDKLFMGKKIGSETAAATGIASMAGFASAMQALPFPINVSTAPAVAAAAGATASGMGAIAMGAASLAIGTDYVPMDGFAYLHKGEKVIPASMQGPGYSGGGGITVVVNHSVSAVDAASFQGHIRRHSNMIANEVTRALKRKGAR